MSSDKVSNDTGSNARATIAGHIGNYRWVICALLFFSTTINYIDRNSLSVLKTTLQSALGWNDVDYGWITTAFTFAYAMFPSLIGFFVDKFGVKKALAGALILWSLAAAAHGLVATVVGFMIVRFVLGLAEAANFPASIKAVAMWFPQKERALATGIFNSGTNIGALVAPMAVPWITLTWGWEWAFVITGGLGFLWLIAWVAFYQPPRKHPRITAAELAYIESDPIEPVTPVPWARLVPHRQTWAFAVGKFMTDPVWWLYLYWVPDFLHRVHHIDLKGSTLPIFVIYQIATIGSVAGGWLPARLLERGWTLNAARKTAMLVPAICVLPIMLAPFVSNLWVAVLLIGIAASAHQAWSANIFTFSSDMFPKRAVGSVVGIGGMAGAVGGMLISLIVGQVLQTTGSYVPIFLMAGLAYLVALGVIHLLVPTIRQVTLTE